MLKGWCNTSYSWYLDFRIKMRESRGGEEKRERRREEKEGGYVEVVSVALRDYPNG